MNLIKQKEITIDTENGPKQFVISRFPAIEGREIIAKYPLSSLPKLGDYKTNEETMYKALAYAGVKDQKTNHLQLFVTREIINNHVDSWETLVKLEKEIIVYNCSFFRDGRAWNFLAEWSQTLPALAIKILTGLSERSSQAEAPASTI